MQATTVSTPTTDLFITILGTTSLTPTATRAGIIPVIALDTSRSATGGGGDTTAPVFAFFALIAISVGLAMSSGAAVARDKGAKHKGSTAAMKDGTQAVTVRFSKKRSSRAYAGSNPQPAARNRGK